MYICKCAIIYQIIIKLWYKFIREVFLYERYKMTKYFPNLWTNSYFVSTVGEAPLSVIKQYIESQRTSQRQ